ncbi:COG4223 family protein [Marivivens aquimaris]|uniref:COG4223 family protein n=1 Tax=Marivivens aquimaris TaxID=2774876 RepID=UPI001882824F|nr:hypothetical protein [Marivivens aquimaris]
MTKDLTVNEDQKSKVDETEAAEETQAEQTDTSEKVEIEHEEVVEDAPAEEAVEQDEPSDEVSEETADDKVVEEVAATELTEEEIAASTEQEVTPTDVEVEEPVVEPQPPVVEEKSSGAGAFIAIVLGGLIAGAIGYGVSWYTLPRIDEADVEARLSLLENELSASGSVDTEALIEAAIGPATADFTTRIDLLQADVEDIKAALENVGTGNGSTIDMSGLEEQIAEQEARLKQLADDAAARLEQARADAEAEEQAAMAAQREVALSRVQTALDTGTPYQDMLSGLEDLDMTVPADLSRPSSTGVATLGELQADFPPASRNALAAARRAGTAGEDGGTFAGFLRNQFDVRSIEARDGDDADAILSRAGAAVQDGRLSDALAEIDTLSEEAKTELDGWVAAAKERQNAIAAVGYLNNTSNE